VSGSQHIACVGIAYNAAMLVGHGVWNPKRSVRFAALVMHLGFILFHASYLFGR
jgi:hypothetical protein